MHKEKYISNNIVRIISRDTSLIVENLLGDSSAQAVIESCYKVLNTTKDVFEHRNTEDVKKHLVYLRVSIGSLMDSLKDYDSSNVEIEKLSEHEDELNTLISAIK